MANNFIPIWNTYPGTLGTFTENSFFSFQLDFTNPLVGALSVTLISGTLPDGLTMSSTGLISGTIDNIIEDQTYNFTVRLTNANGTVDRNFSITVNKTTPQWLDPTNLGTIVMYSVYEYQFFVTDPGGTQPTFVKISGELPPGIVLSSAGFLSGLISVIDSNTTYTFTIRSYFDNGLTLDKTFSLSVTIAGNRAPLWNTPAGLLGDILGSVPFSIQISAGDPNHNNIIYTAFGLPTGFSISSGGLISGTLPNGTPALYSFSVVAFDSILSTSRIFQLSANNQQTYPIIWLTPAGSIGSIDEGEKSILSVSATSVSRWLRYELVAGRLPLGLSLDINTGDIWGLAQDQVDSDTVISFSISAYNEFISSTRDFSILLINALDSSNMITFLDAPPVAPIGVRNLIGLNNIIPDSFIGDGSTTTFTLSASAASNDNLEVDVGGISISPSDYSVSGNSLIFNSAPPLNSVIAVKNLTTGTLIVDELTSSMSTSYTLSSPALNVDELEIAIGGISISPSDYSVSGTTLTFNIAPPDNTPLTVRHLGQPGIVYDSFVGNNTQTIFTLSQAPTSVNSLDITIGGISIPTSDYVITGSTMVSAALYGKDRSAWSDLITSYEIPIGSIFREGDSQYGLVRDPRILVVQNLNSPAADSIYNALTGMQEVKLTLGEVAVAYAVDNSQVVYEVLYRKVYDDGYGSVSSYIDPVTSQTIQPGSIINIRERLLNVIGSDGGTDTLPLFMTSEQTIGDPTTVLGYIPALVFAYVNPGQGLNIADKLNSDEIPKEKLYFRRVLVDRLIMEPSASTDFEPQFVKFV